MSRTLSLSRLVTAAVLLAALTPLAACGASGDEVDESKLVIYSGRQENLVGPLLERFEKDTGVEISVRYGNTAQLAAQLLEEGDRTEADVYFSQDGGALGALSKKQMLAELKPDELNRVPAEYRAEDGRWVGTSGRARVIVYDPTQVPEADVPDSVFELTDPKWKGKVGVAPSNASFEAFVTAIRVLKGDDVAAKWLSDMKANDVQTFDNNVLILNAAEDSEIALGLINHYYWFEQVAEEGAEAVPAKLKFLPGGDPGALVNVAGVGVLEGSDHADEAHQLVEYMLSEKGQRFFAEETKEYPLIQGVPTAEGLPPLTTLQKPAIDLSDLDTLEQTLTMIEEAGLT